MSVADAAVYDKIVLSPGPGIPVEAGILMDLIRTYAATKPILGVCLGHQAIAEAFGAELYNLSQVVHGKSVPTRVAVPDPMFEGLPPIFHTGRYHSWAVREQSLPAELEATAYDDQHVVMALRHRSYNVRGVQFHPESVMTEYGEKMMSNWLLYTP